MGPVTTWITDDGYVVFAFVVITLPIAALYVYSVVDLFRRKGLSGIKKAGWGVWIVFVPAVGVLMYLAFRPTPPPPGKRDRGENTGVVDEAERLHNEHDAGRLDDTDYLAAKRALFRV